MSTKVEVEVFGPAGNFALVRMPDRRNVGAVVQLDSLERLAGEMREAIRCISAGDGKGATDTIGGVIAELDEVIRDAIIRSGPAV